MIALAVGAASAVAQGNGKGGGNGGGGGGGATTFVITQDTIPPTVTFTPTGGVYSNSTLSVTVGWCDNSSLTSTTAAITFNSHALTGFNFVTGTKSGCTKYATTALNLTLQPGTNTLSGSIQDAAGNTGYGSASYTYNAPPAQSLVADFSNNNNNDQILGLCAVSCFASAFTQSTVSYRSVGVDRAITLRYNSDRTSVRPVVSADLSLYSGTTTPPDSLTLQAVVNGQTQTFVNGETTLRFSAPSTSWQGTPLPKLHMAGQLDLHTLATQMYPMTVTVTAYFTGKQPETYTNSSKVMVVNLNSYDLLPTKGWTIGGVQRLYRQPDGTALIVEGDGSGVYFACAMNPGSTCSGPVGDYTRLRYDGSTYTRGYPDSSQITFDTLGRMNSAKDRWGNAMTYTYDAATGRLLTIRDPAGFYFQFTYGTGSFTIAPPAPGGGPPNGTRLLTVSYDGSGRITRFQDPDNLATQFQYDTLVRVSRVINRAGDTTRFAYDPVTWKVRSVGAPTIQVDAGNGLPSPVSLVTTYLAWQTLGVPKTATSGVKAPLLRADTMHAVIVRDSVLNDATLLTADRWGQVLRTRGPLGDTTLIVRVDVHPTVVVSSTGQIDSLWYARAAWETSTQSPSWLHPASDTLWGANSTGPFVTKVRSVTSSVTDLRYDKWGRVSSVKVHPANSTSGPSIYLRFGGGSVPIDTVVSSASGTDYRYYDSRGRDTLDVDYANHRQATHYNTTWGSADSSTVRDTTGAAMSSSSVKLDRYGRDSLVFGTGTDTAQVAYDILGRDSLVWRSTTASPIQFTYGPLLLTTIRDLGGRNHTTDYNALGWPTAVHDVVNPSLSTQYLYDREGRITTLTNRRGSKVNLTYDRLGRVLSQRGTSADDRVFYGYSYSVAGDTIVGSTYRTSDNTPLKVDTIFVGKDSLRDSITTVLQGIPGGNVVLRNRHFNNPTSDLIGTNRSWSGSSPLHNVIWYKDPGTGRLFQVNLGTTQLSLKYTNEGLLDTLVFGDGNKLTLTYTNQHVAQSRGYVSSVLDSILGRTNLYRSQGTSPYLSDEKWRGPTQGGGRTYVSRNFGYQADGSLNSYRWLHTENRTCNGTTTDCSMGGTFTDQKVTLGYDAGLNLTSASDSVLNRMVTPTYTADRMTQWSADTTLSYDADGNRTQKVTGTTTTLYRWNAAGQLVNVSNGTDSVAYDYDAFGNLFRRSTNAAIDRYFLWDRGELYLELDASGAKLREYAYAGVNRPLAVWQGTNASPEYYAHDDRGNTIGRFTGGTVLASYHFTPWGTEDYAASIPESQRFGWKGLTWEPGATSLYYVRARWYDPTTHGFISEDPIGLAGGLNGYAYADQNAVMGWDPSGLSDDMCGINGNEACHLPGVNVTADACPSSIWDSWFNAECHGSNPDDKDEGTPPPEPPVIKWIRAHGPSNPCTHALLEAGASALSDAILLTPEGEVVEGGKLLLTAVKEGGLGLLFAGTARGATAFVASDIAYVGAGQKVGMAAAARVVEVGSEPPEEKPDHWWQNPYIPVVGTISKAARAYHECKEE